MALFVRHQEHRPVPEGIYIARVDSIEAYSHPEYGESIKWGFTLQDSRVEINGSTVSAMCSTKTSPKSKLTAWLQAFGIFLEIDQQFDVETLLGQICRVRVKNRTTVKNVNGVEKTLTFSNVDGVAP